jgi:site-specific DNA-cytosine methylase
MSAAVADLPMRPVFFSEIEPFPSAVLKSHFPDVPNLGDMSKITVTNEGKEITNGSVRIVLDERLDIFAGGTPCQDVSVAGKRRGMEEGSNTRSSLAFEFVRLVRELRPRFVIWENVAGVLSDKSFPEFLTALANCGYGVAYRTLDAQWVRVADCYHANGGVVRMERAIPQRRRRVWVVGCAGGDVTKAAQILFEPKGVAGDNAPRRRTGQEIAAASRGRNSVHGGMVEGAPRDRECVSIEGNGNRPSHRGDAVSEEGCSYTINAIEQHKVAYSVDSQGGAVPSSQEESAGTIVAASNSSGNNLQGVAVFNKVSHPHGKNGEGEDGRRARLSEHAMCLTLARRGRRSVWCILPTPTAAM